MQISIDTSVLIGLLDRADLWHSAATALQSALIVREAEVVLFDCVLAEAVSTLARRVHEKRRTTDLDAILHSLQTQYPLEAVAWLFPDVPRLYSAIIDLVRRSQGELNFNDALIALACRERAIPYLASFDRDFDQVDWLIRVAQPDDLL
ncbi:MAG: type II toxin-antitoxin system VapC family toxin [Ardenticatenales bacterium]|nr:type II toxin-antitoxin system VapC family toxin [Ardenticatenales bacterium]